MSTSHGQHIKGKTTPKIAGKQVGITRTIQSIRERQ